MRETWHSSNFHRVERKADKGDWVGRATEERTGKRGEVNSIKWHRKFKKFFQCGNSETIHDLSVNNFRAGCWGQKCDNFWLKTE